MYTRIAFSLLFVLTLAGCELAPIAAESAVTYSATGAYNAARWSDETVPGSQAPRPGTQLPLYLVCEVEGDDEARAAAVVTDAALRLYENGSAEFSLNVGTWMRRDGVETSSGETISRWGNWTEGESGLVTLSGFNLPGLGQTLQYTALGNAELAVTLACPGGSSVESVNPTLTFTRTQ